VTGRLGLPGLPTPHPVGATLPAVYEEDRLAQVLMGAIDEMLAPVQSTLDCLTAYVDAGQAPADFVDWLGEWVSAPFDRSMPAARRRRLLGATGSLQRARGTQAGLVDLLTLALGATDVEVTGGGGTWWSAEPGSYVPEEVTTLVVRVTLPRHEPADLERVERLVASAVPAHLPCRVEVTADGEVPELRTGDGT
jgi:phage tail-like protein